MSSFRVHPWPVNVCPLKRKGIFASRYYSHVNVEAIDVYFFNKYYIIVDLKLKKWYKKAMYQNEKVNIKIKYRVHVSQVS